MSWVRVSTLNWIQRLAIRIVKSGRIPKHVAFIMDGNRRYAKKNNVKKAEGHSKGFDKLSETLQWCLELGIFEVTVFAFSIENFKRSKQEVDELLELARQKFQRLLDERDKLNEHGICIRVIGNFYLIPEDIKKQIAEAMIMTKDNKRAILNVAFAYTSSDEITSAIKNVVEGVDRSELNLEDINEDLINKCLHTRHSPEPDLLIRTSGEIRFSDFLLWQTSNSCIYFAKRLWPEFSVYDLLSAILYYQKCKPDLELTSRQLKQNTPVCNSRVTSYIFRLEETKQKMLEESLDYSKNIY